MRVGIGDRFRTSWVTYEVYEIEEYDVDGIEDAYARMMVVERFDEQSGVIGSKITMSYHRIEQLLKTRLFKSLNKTGNFNSLYEKLQ